MADRRAHDDPATQPLAGQAQDEHGRPAKTAGGRGARPKINQGTLMKIALNVIAVVAILLGGLWILQGLNILPGSFMSGHIIWTGNGAFLAVFAVGLLVWNNRRRTPKT
jgi:hypothetical protein